MSSFETTAGIPHETLRRLRNHAEEHGTGMLGRNCWHGKADDWSPLELYFFVRASIEAVRGGNSTRAAPDEQPVGGNEAILDSSKIRCETFSILPQNSSCV